MSYTQNLYQLQQLDSRVDATNRRLSEISAALVETDALKQARTQFDAAETAHKKLNAQVLDLNLEVKGLQQKITRNEQRLYSGKGLSPKEAGSLQDEVDSTKRWLSKREEDLLEAMIALEEAESVLQQRRKAFEQARLIWETEQNALLTEQARLKEEVAGLVKTRPAAAQLVKEADLKQYELLRRKKAGVAVTGVDDGDCLACGVMLSSHLVQQARLESKLYFCDSCGRIMHVL